MTIGRRLTMVLLRSVTLTLVVFMLSGPPAYAATPSVTDGEWHTLQVTHNWTRNQQPQLGGERLVWQAYDGTDWEILTYDLTSGSIVQLTDDGIDESDPRLDGAHLVWTTQPFPPGVHLPSLLASTLSLYDFETQTVVPIPESEGVQGSPQITGDLVVWEAGPDSASTDIYVYSLTTGQTRRLTNDAYPQSEPATRTIAAISRASLGRPGLRFPRNAHLRLTSSRCQRSTVCGDTGRHRHSARGSSPLAAAKRIRSRRFSGGRRLRPSTRNW